MQQLIINADDFGLTDGICQAIVELGKVRGISSTTAMLGVPGALPRIHQYWDKLTIPCGVHLHVTYGAPVSKVMQQYCASRWDGDFPRSRPEIDFPLEVLLEECRAQIELFNKEFGRPSHFDAHHGFQCDVRYREGLLKLAKEVGLPVRGAEDDQMADARALGVTQTYLLEGWSNTGWDDVEAGFSKLKEVVAQAQVANFSDVWELICHPGYTDDHLRAISSLNDRRDVERQILSSVEMSGLLADNNIQLVDFKSIKEKTR